MKIFPTLETARLLLRRFEPADAPVVRTLLDDPEIIGNLLDQTPLYALDDAAMMIRQSHSNYEAGTHITFAIARKSNHDLIGCCDLELHPKHQRGQIAYWIGRPYWWQGYATEAAKSVVRFAFETQQLNRIFASVLTENTVSASVLKKAGLQWESTQRQASHVAGEFKDVDIYGLVRDDFQRDDL